MHQRWRDRLIVLYSPPSSSGIAHVRLYQPLHQVKLFINCLLASADYDSFFNVMKKEAEKSLRTKRLLGQESKPAGGEADGVGEGKERDRPGSSSAPQSGECKAAEERRHSDERSYK